MKRGQFGWVGRGWQRAEKKMTSEGMKGRSSKILVGKRLGQGGEWLRTEVKECPCGGQEWGRRCREPRSSTRVQVAISTANPPSAPKV